MGRGGRERSLRLVVCGRRERFFILLRLLLSFSPDFRVVSVFLASLVFLLPHSLFFIYMFDRDSFFMNRHIDSACDLGNLVLRPSPGLASFSLFLSV